MFKKDENVLNSISSQAPLSFDINVKQGRQEVTVTVGLASAKEISLGAVIVAFHFCQ